MTKARFDDRRRSGEPRRKLILEHLKRKPGLSFRGLLRATGIPAGAVAHHLRVLLREHRAWCLRVGPAMMLFAGAAPASAAEVQEIWRKQLDDINIRVLDVSRGLASQTEIRARCPDLPCSTVQFRLARLVRRGFLKKVPGGRRVRYLHPEPRRNLTRRGATWKGLTGEDAPEVAFP